VTPTPHPLTLRLFAETLAVVRLASNAAVPEWIFGNDFLSITRTRRELSIVCRDEAVPSDVSEVQRGYRAFAVTGTLDFAEIGIIAALSIPLAEAGVPIFGISTYDTDHLLVPEAMLEAAIAALREAGHTVREASAP
jgi:hypothetical protein